MAAKKLVVYVPDEILDALNRFTATSPKSRSEIPEYVQMEQMVSQAAGRINGAYGEADWTPIRYVNRAYSRTALSGLYRASKVGLVTPLRDGMNLVAKEYVAAQDPLDPGVLILSRFAGAADELTEAIIVNPFDADEIAQAMHVGLSMSLEERQRRYHALRERVWDTTARKYCTRFLSYLDHRERTLPRFQLQAAS